MLYFGHHLLLLFALLSVPTWADSGDDFSNNLFSDLARLLALFGERVTIQLLSQSMGWADCIILAVAPLGIITTIVTAIRVDGPPWLKGIIGRSRENLSAAEMELMSSTSQETCGGTIKRTRFMKLSEAIDQKLVQKQRMFQLKLGEDLGERKVNIFNIFSRSKWSHTEPQPSELSSQNSEGGKRYLWDTFRSRQKSRDVEVPTPILLENRSSEAQAEPSPASELIVLRNTTKRAPNITLNRHHKVDRGHLYMVASFGVLLELGVLVYFGFITYYPSLKFKKDDKQVLRYAFPFAADGTIVLVLGADVDARCRFKRTALQYACVKNNLEIVNILIGSGADFNAEEQFHRTLLWDAAHSGSTECVGRLLKVENIDMNTRRTSDEGPLELAIGRGHGDIVRMLVEKDAKINQHIVDFAVDLYEPGERKVKEEVEEEDDDEEVEDQGEMHAEEENKRLGLKTEDIGRYIRAAFSLRNAFEDHVHGEMGGIILSELIRRLWPP